MDWFLVIFLWSGIDSSTQTLRDNSSLKITVIFIKHLLTVVKHLLTVVVLLNIV